MALTPRPHLAGQALPAHGALDYHELERLGIPAAEVIDFSTNVNPYGPPPGTLRAVHAASIGQYPDRDCLALRRALGARLGVGIERIAPGNGTVELLWAVGLAYIHPGDRVLVVGPTFGEYSHVAQVFGAQVHQPTALPLGPNGSFRIEAREIESALQIGAYRLAFLCNPNNPTGGALPLETVRSWAHANPETLFILDEAYLPFADGVQSAIPDTGENLLVLRSMTKDYALAGLRLGYAVGPAGVIQALRLVKPPWSVNAVAQQAGLAALEDEGFLPSALADLRAHTLELVERLSALGLRPVPSCTHFFLIRVGNAAAVRLRLLRRRVQVRDCASFGLPEYIRVSTRLPEDNDRLVFALEKECT